MRKLFLIAGVSAGALVFAQAAAADGSFKIRAGQASTTYTADYSGFITSYKGDSGTANYTATTYGFTYTTPVGIYFDLSGSGGSGTHDSWRAITSAPQDFKRNDAQFVVGLPVGSSTSFYFGYKTGTTKMAAPKGTFDPGLGATGGNIGWSQDTFTAQGIIFGGGTGIPLGEDGRAGVIGLNAGLGVMKANWKDDSCCYSVDADIAVGFSLGASYTYQFTPHFGATVDYKYNSYSYDFNAGMTNEFKIGEKTSAVGASLFATF